MTEFTLSITLGNAAMSDHIDIAGTLRDVADTLEFTERDAGNILDLNGNTVGEWEISK